jgi:glycosyltransferase involved in cell wall biosynthesis
MERERLSIVHVTTFYPPHNFGGDGMHVQRLCRALARRGHSVSVVHAPAAHEMLGRRAARIDIGDNVAHDDAVTVHALDAGWRGALETLLVQQTGKPLLQRATLRGLLRGAGDDEVDVIHYHNVSLIGGTGVLAMGDAVKLYTTHEYWLACPTHLLFRYDREICDRRTCYRCTMRNGRPPQLWRRAGYAEDHLDEVDRFIFPSALAESVYREQGIKGPGTVLHHFLPDDYFQAAETLGDRAADVEPYYLFVGRLDAVKGIEPLVRHFAAGEGAPLVVVGDGRLAPKLHDRFGSHPRIRLLGGLSPAELGILYRDALALILPSSGYEIFGLVVLEAFAHGTPAIVTDVAGAAELVRAANAGYVYGSAAALDDALGALSDPAHRNELGANGRAYARRVHREREYVDRYEAIIGEVRRR